MIPKNAKSKTPAARTDKEEREYEPDGKKPRGTGCTSQNSGSESIGTSRDDRQEGNSTSLTGGTLIGGMLGLLIVTTRDQLEQSESHTQKLRDHLQKLEEIALDLKSGNSDSNTE